MHSLPRIIPTFWLGCLPLFIISQNISITYINPPAFTVCDTVQFEATVANTLADTLFSPTLTGEMPMGIAYLLGSVAGAMEANTSSPNAPIFGLEKLPPGESVTVTWQAITQCLLIDAINNGDLFTNKYTVNFTGGSTSITTTPYVIETALLQIVSLNDQMMSGVTGDILTRTWVLTNTRLGALSNLTFTDLYGDGISISSPMGTVITQSPGILELNLTGSDFMNFGDGDGLFELNEQIVITESIEITGCGSPPQSTSFLTASWGCHGIACQSVSTTGVVAIAPGSLGPVIQAVIVDPFPADYCATISNTQGIQLTNTGDEAAVDLAVYISHFNQGSMGLQQNSLSISIGGNAVTAAVDFFNPVGFDECATPPGVFDSVAIVIPELLPGETTILEWEAFVCAVDCDATPPSWRFDYFHENNCPPGSFGSGGATSQNYGAAVLLSQFVEFYIGDFLENNGEYTLTYTLKSPLLVDSTGVLRIDMELPCGVGWGDNAGFNLNAQSPDSVEITPSFGGGTDVSLYFDLPFGVDSVGSDFNITFACDSNCFELPDCIVEFISSCPIPPGTGVIEDLTVNVNSTILLNEASCGPQSCEDFPLTYFCEASTNEICPDTIIGYFVTDLDFHRENLGLPDNDNNRFADGFGNLDLNLIRRDRALSGDTLHTTVNAVMNVDIPGATLPNAIVLVNFESHSIDDGWDGGQFMDTLAQLPLVADVTGFRNLGGTISITDASTGEVYECILPPPSVANMRRGEISVVNTRPKDVLDVWFYVSYAYDITPAFLLANGCNIPPGWEFENGDAIEASVYHKAIYNPGTTRVINMRTVSAVFAANLPGPLQDEYFACGASFTRWQLGGYRYTISPGLYQMPSCATSNEPGGTRFEFRIARPNFFPFEFRSFVDLVTWEYTVPNFVTLLNSEIEVLNIQGGPTILSNTPFPWSGSGPVYSFNMNNIPVETLDEGFLFQLNHEWELPCNVAAPQQLQLHAFLDFAPSLVETDPLDTIVIGPATFFPIRPAMALIPVNINHESTTNLAMWEFELGNFTSNDEDAPNAWLTVLSPSGQITDFQLINTTTGQILTPENGIFQLGDLPPNWSNEFQLLASINNCDPDLVEVTFGWNCNPYTDLMQEACAEETSVLTLSALLGEIEMKVESPVSPFQLCDTIGYHTVEIFNAQFGAVYDLELLALLPPGLTIIPGSSEMSYPTGSAFQPVADPVLVNGDTALYNLSALNPTLGDLGLLGFANAPDHSVTIRFKAASSCGFVSPSQIIFNASATQGCGLDANNLSKPGAELFIEGVTPLYETDIVIGTNVPPTLSCGDDIQIDVTLDADAVTAATDSVFVLVPPGLAYQPGSYSPGMNASPNAPIVDFSNNQFVLKWPLVPGLQPFTTISFSMVFSAVAGGECDSTVLEIVTYQLQEAECIATGSLCSILAETGRKDLPVQFTIPSLGLDNLMLFVENGLVNYNLLLENNGNATSNDVFVEFYNDVDNSGTLTPGDNLLNTYTHSGGLGMGEIVPIAGSFPAFYSVLCNIIAVVSSQNNCTCTEEVLMMEGEIPYFFEPDSTCFGIITPIGLPIPAISGHTYQWSPPDGLSCADCPNPILNTNELSIPSLPATITIEMQDTYPNGCVVNYQFPIVIGVGGSVLPDIVLEKCPNVVIPLSGEIGATSYDWEGPGIIDSSLQDQVIVLTDTAVVTLIWTDEFNCPNTLNYIINVPEEMLIDTFPLCTGDSIVIDNVTYFDEVEICDTITTPAGCDVVRCRFYEPRDTPVLDFPLDTLCFLEGTEITIDQLGTGFSTYQWTPSEPLSCDTCALPMLEVINQTFEVTVSDGTTCRATTQVAVIGIPPCSTESILLPNVFTPNNDNTNDRFGPVWRPGVDKLVTSAKLRIWDRWGTKVYEGEGVSGIVWDGNFKGKSAASDVYVFMLELACEEEEIVVKGDVTLLR